ncbi:uncharacterized protein LOC143859216 isoform X2 [Tasmannia lanceolata]|uniref:uncharacterized protein LOC143859216 isoform X2 n=1 Tax=Tasmannia lanceolata TaxID=3420 RepID=UPI004062F380
MSFITSKSAMLLGSNSMSRWTAMSGSTGFRQISHMMKPLINKLALVRKLEAQGLPTKLAEDVADGFCDCLDNLAQNVVFKVELKMEWSQREIEKFRNDIEKSRIDKRYEIDKVIAGHRLDLNLERGTSIVLEDFPTTFRMRVFPYNRCRGLEIILWLHRRLERRVLSVDFTRGGIIVLFWF